MFRSDLQQLRGTSVSIGATMYDVYPLDPSITWLAMNDNGVLAGFTTTPGGFDRGQVRKVSGDLVSIPPSADYGTELWDINNSEVAVGRKDQAFVFYPIISEDGVTNDIRPATSDRPAAEGWCSQINDNGLIVIHNFFADDQRSVFYDFKSDTVGDVIDALAGGTTTVLALNNRGDVAGLCSNALVTPPDKARAYFKKWDGPYVLLEQRDSYNENDLLFDINDSGQLVGSVGTAEAPWWWPRTFNIDDTPLSNKPIQLPPGFTGGHALSINNSGNIVGTCWTDDTYQNNQRAFVFNSVTEVSIDLQLAIDYPVVLAAATIINNKGYILARSDGPQSHFLLIPRSTIHIVPSVGEMLALLLGGVTRDGGGIGVVGTFRIPIDPLGWKDLSREQRDVILIAAISQLSSPIEVGMDEHIRRAAFEEMRDGIDKNMAVAAQLAATAKLIEPAFRNGLPVGCRQDFLLGSRPTGRGSL